MAYVDAPDVREAVVAVCAVGERHEGWSATLGVLVDVVDHVIVVGPGMTIPAALADRCRVVEDRHLSAVISEQAGGCDLQVVITDPCIADRRFLAAGVAAMRRDPRLATVSFLSNSAGYLSAPYRNQPFHHQIGQHDERSLHEAMSGVEPTLGLVPIPMAAGGVVLISSHVVRLIGSLDPALDPATGVADFSLRAARRGFISAVDADTFVLRPWDLRWPQVEVTDTRVGRTVLDDRYPFLRKVFEADSTSRESPIGIVLGLARAKLLGLRVGIDGTCLGPKEMGTQVQTLALVGALAARDDIDQIHVAVPGPIPPYAEQVLGHRKVLVVRSADGSFPAGVELDVIHRPFQPDHGLPFQAWRTSAPRLVVTIQDLIAYQVGAYHPEADRWYQYRRAVQSGVRNADGVVVISHDTAAMLHAERLVVDADRIAVVENGTDHLRGDEAASEPRRLREAGWSARPLVVVLGANYSHKNRDLAISAWAEMRRRGHPHALVMVGAAVPIGSSRDAEAEAVFAAADRSADVMTLADVSSEERNWLLRHADVVMYPTSAEGFGLVPFEAARFGTPCVSVGFGPLHEVAPDLPVRARSWDPVALADAAGALLADPEVGRRQCRAALEAGARYTWQRTAEGLTAMYLRLVGRPGRHDTLGAL